MPHLIVEYSSNLPAYPEAQALAELNAAVCASPEVLDEADLKSRFASSPKGDAPSGPAKPVPRGRWRGAAVAQACVVVMQFAIYLIAACAYPVSAGGQFGLKS